MTLRTKVVIVAVYFGDLPPNMQLWLDSCAWNPEFNWLLLTDTETSCYSVPPNVLIRRSTLAEVREVFSEHVGFMVCLDRAYKLCDFRPLYWALVAKFGLECDFWGYCDLDLVFGKLRSFLSDDLFANNDRLFRFGHLSLFRNSSLSNNSYKLVEHPKWREVFSTSTSFGFDEHSGINRAWETPPMRFHWDDANVADIAPEFDGLRLTSVGRNRTFQRFYVTEGSVIRESWSVIAGRRQDEYIYMHFQKRKLIIPPVCEQARKTFFFRPDRISFSSPQPWRSCLAYWCMDMPQIIQAWARYLKQHVSSFRRARRS